MHSFVKVNSISWLCKVFIFLIACILNNGIASENTTAKYQWMNDQIAEDLITFQKGITREMLNFTEAKLTGKYPIMRCRIFNNKLRVSTKLNRSHPRVANFIAFFNC